MMYTKEGYAFFRWVLQLLFTVRSQQSLCQSFLRSFFFSLVSAEYKRQNWFAVVMNICVSVTIYIFSCLLKSNARWSINWLDLKLDCKEWFFVRFVCPMNNSMNFIFEHEDLPKAMYFRFILIAWWKFNEFRSETEKKPHIKGNEKGLNARKKN